MYLFAIEYGAYSIAMLVYQRVNDNKCICILSKGKVNIPINKWDTITIIQLRIIQLANLFVALRVSWSSVFIRKPGDLVTVLWRLFFNVQIAFLGAICIYLLDGFGHLHVYVRSYLWDVSFTFLQISWEELNESDEGDEGYAAKTSKIPPNKKQRCSRPVWSEFDHSVVLGSPFFGQTNVLTFQHPKNGEIVAENWIILVEQ